MGPLPTPPQGPCLIRPSKGGGGESGSFHGPATRPELPLQLMGTSVLSPGTYCGCGLELFAFNKNNQIKGKGNEQISWVVCFKVYVFYVFV